jgi:glutaredoxin/glutathione-dependent peroxiredoxin
MTIQVGDRMPETTFYVMTDAGPTPLKSADLFSGKTVVLFGVPGAFTPTCSNNHLPGYVQHGDLIKAKGVDEIAVVAVNDSFVMKAWAQSSGGVGKITFLSDGNGEFARAAGLELDGSGRGLGLRLKRFSMVVKNGVVANMAIENSPGEAAMSGAEAMLSML